jgi:hypothetical protein
MEGSAPIAALIITKEMKATSHDVCEPPYR